MPQFPKVNVSRGAPMGRSEYGTPETPAHLFKVNLDSGGYDDGGAYWGHSPGESLYCLQTKAEWDAIAQCDTEESQHFYRARYRMEAIRLAMEQFPDLTLKSMPRLYNQWLEGKAREQRQVPLKLKE